MEMCVWCWLRMCQRGVPQGALEQVAPSTTGDVRDHSNDRLGWDRHRQTHHWICAVDADGREVVSVKVANVEADIVAALATVTDLADQVVCAVDIVGAPSALILALLARAQSRVFYASGRVVNTMSAAYTGEGKTDAKDAYVIAETLVGSELLIFVPKRAVS
jgi:transposase